MHRSKQRVLGGRGPGPRCPGGLWPSRSEAVGQKRCPHARLRGGGGAVTLRRVLVEQPAAAVGARRAAGARRTAGPAAPCTAAGRGLAWGAESPAGSCGLPAFPAEGNNLSPEQIQADLHEIQCRASSLTPRHWDGSARPAACGRGTSLDTRGQRDSFAATGPRRPRQEVPARGATPHPSVPRRTQSQMQSARAARRAGRRRSVEVSVFGGSGP